MNNMLLLSVASMFYIIIITILFYSKERTNNKETKLYSKLLIVLIFEIFFEISMRLLSDEFSSLYVLNIIVAKVFLLLTILWFTILTLYNAYISLPKKYIKKYDRFKKIAFYFIFVSIFIVFALPIEFYFKPENNYYSYTFGPSVNYVYLTCLIIMIVNVYIILKSIRNKNIKKYTPIILCVVLFATSALIQKCYPEIILNIFVQSLVSFLMYHTIENPDVKMIKQLEVAKEQADKANHAKSEFLSSMSHEIRTPLNAIMGFSNGLLEEDINDSAKSDVKNIVMASENLLELVNGILDISKIEANKLEIIETPYNFRNMFDELVLLTKARLGDKPLDFKYSYDKNIPEYLYGDAIRLKQVIINLLTNAVKYTNSGYMMLNISGKIKEDKVKLVITVQDSGIGIKKENIDKLFSKFDRLGVEKETSVEGTGLGLAITKKLVELMHGNINVQSEYGSGSKFIIRVDQKILEGEELEKAKNKKPVQTEQIIDAHGKKVLVVDDNLLNIKVAERLLAKYNVTIESVMSGQECLDKVNAGKYDLILLDDMMPKMTGGETFVKLKEIEGFNTPVVILTANAITGMREQYLSEGFDDYLAKPIEQLELNRVMKKYLS